MPAVRRNTNIVVPTTQRGVIAISAAVMMLALFSFLALTVDTGRLFLAKRTMQKQSDLAALETALLYCRDQSMDAAQRLAVAQDVLASDRNNFQGEINDVQVALGQVRSAVDTEGESFRQFTADADGKAVQVTLRRTIRASIFQQLMPSGARSITLVTNSVAEACQPIASLHLRTNLLTIDTSKSILLNTVLGGLLGANIDLGVAAWNGLLNTNINLFSYLDAIAIGLGIDVGDRDRLLATEVSVGDLFTIAADVLTPDNTAEFEAQTALEDLAAAIPGATLIKLGDVLNIKTGTDEAGLDTDLQLLELVQVSAQAANNEAALAVDLPINIPSVAGVNLKLQVLDPPDMSVYGNPERDEIYIRSSQVRVLASVDLPIVGAVLDGLEALLTSPVLAAVNGLVTDLLNLDILSVLEGLSCAIYCNKDYTLTDLKILEGSRLDLLVQAGSGEARVEDYYCDENGDKQLDVNARSSAVELWLGQFGDTPAEAAEEAFGLSSPEVSPIPILDIGAIEGRMKCTLLIACWDVEYKTESGSYSPDRDQAARIAYYGGGLGLRLNQTSLLTGQQTLRYYNSPSEEYLPEYGKQPDEEAYQSMATDGLADNFRDTLLGIELKFFPPSDGNGGLSNNVAGWLLYGLGSVLTPLLDALGLIVHSVLSPILGVIIDGILDLLGIGIAEIDVGSTLTCESNKVQLVM